MTYQPTAIDGAFIVETTPHRDERGLFVRAFDADEFAKHGLASVIAQCDLSHNLRAGTLRGMHSQRAPHEQAKIVRCVRGAIYDVIVDLRVEAPTYLQHVGVTLSAENRLALYIPKGVFHGFQTLEDATDVFYLMSDPYVPDAGFGYRWNDPAFGIRWPRDVTVISARDVAYPDYAPPPKHS